MRIQYPDQDRALRQVRRHSTESGPAPVWTWPRDCPDVTWVTEVFAEYQRRLRLVSDAFMAGRPYVTWAPADGRIVAYEAVSDGRMFHSQCARPYAPMDPVRSQDLRLLRNPVCSGCGGGWYE